MTSLPSRTIEDWNRFWFSPTGRERIVPVRVAICICAALWMGTFWPNINEWFGETGLLSVGPASNVVAYYEFPAWQSWSPLWWTDAVGFYYAWIVAGLIVACLGACGIGGRATMLLLTLWMVAWAHRIVWLAGPVEPALIALVAYLAIEPGPPVVTIGQAKKDKPDRVWTANLALRLIQTHWWILVAVGLMSQMYSIIWWRGEALWWLAASGRSLLFSREQLRGNVLLVNSLTHAIVVCEILALWLVTVGRSRWLGVGFGLLVSFAIGLVADQTLYAMLLASALLAFTSFIESAGREPVGITEK